MLLQSGEAYLSIPPTKAFNMINSTDGNVTAFSYASFAEFVAGSGIVLTFDYATNKIMFNSTAPTGSILLLSGNETDVSTTVSNTDTIVRTYSLGANNYSSIIIESEIEISYGLLSTPQDILLKIKDGGSTKETFTTHSLGQVGISSITAKVSFAQTNASTITITQSGAGTDANTNILIHSLRVYAVT